jgi:hypothetical protein
MPWLNREKCDVYDEQKELATYITLNLRDLASEDEFTAYWLARHIEDAEDNPRNAEVYDEILSQHPAGIIAIAARGSTAIQNDVRDKIECGLLPLNRCPECQRIVRTPLAKQCLWCGHDWHHAQTDFAT